MPSSRNNSCSSSKPKPKANKKSSSSPFGFKRGFLNKNVSSSSSSSSGLSTTVVPSTAVQTASTTPNKNATAAAAAAAATLAPPPVQEWGTCAICCYPLPLNADEIVYNACCGETICLGCIMSQKRTLIIGTDVQNPVNGSTEEELEFERISLSEDPVCPFCRAEGHEGDDELLKRLFKQIDKYKDPRAMIMAGAYYVEGLHGVSKDLTKAEELYKRSYDLGYPMAAHRLYELFHNHIPNGDKVVAMKYLEEGARRGLAHSIFQLAHHVYRDGNRGDGTRRFMMAARCGHENAMDTLMKCYRQGLLSNEDLATTRRDYTAAMEAVTSEPREYAKRYNKFVTKLYETRNMNIKNYS